MAIMIGQILNMVESLLWMCGVLQMKPRKDAKRQAAAVGLFFCALLWDSIIGFGFNASPIWLAIECLIYILFFSEKTFEIIVKFLHAVFFMGIISEPIKMFIDLWNHCNGLELKGEAANFFSDIFLIFALGILSFCIGKDEQKRNWICRIPLKYYEIGIFFGFSASGVGGFSNAMAEGMPLRAYVFYRTISMILEEFVYISSLVIVYLADLNGRYQKESVLKSELLDQSRAHFVSLEQQVRQVHRIRHDMRAHLQVLYSFFEKEDAEGGCNYLQKMDSQLVRTAGNRVSVGNDMVDAVIEGELSRLPEDVTFSCTGAIMEELQVDEFDLCTIFSNLLANAMEACERLKAHEKRITLLLKQYQGHQIIEIRNPVEWKVDVAQIGKFTTKKDSDNHGLGLLNVMDTVEKYEGTIQFEVKDGEFTVYVRL